MRFIKIITGQLEQRYCEKFYEEIAIDADKIVSVNHYHSSTSEEFSIFNPEKYMSAIIIEMEEERHTFPIPASMEVVMDYLNGKVGLEALKDYKMPVPNAPEDLHEWIDMLENDLLKEAIQKLINNDITTKTQLKKLSGDEIRALPGCGGASNVRSRIKRILYMFGLMDGDGKPIITNPFLDEPLEALMLSPRAYNGLHRKGYRTVGDVASATYFEISHVRNIGKKAFNEIVEKLGDHGIKLQEDES